MPELDPLELDKDELAFILGLEKLTRDTGMMLSPDGVLTRVENEASRDNPEAGYGFEAFSYCFGTFDRLIWIDPENEDDWIDYSHTIVRPT
jgi:uncharacterized protein with von Willebrand factor type A (vWA) domain